MGQHVLNRREWLLRWVRDIQHQVQSTSQAPRGTWGKSETLANKNAIVNINFPEILLWHGFQDTSWRIVPQKFCPQSLALTEDLPIKYVDMISHPLQNEIKAKTVKGPNNSQHKAACDSSEGLICMTACKHRGEEPQHHFPWHGIQGRPPGVALIVSLVELPWGWHGRGLAHGVGSTGPSGDFEQAVGWPVNLHSLNLTTHCENCRRAPRKTAPKSGLLTREVFKQLK